MAEKTGPEKYAPPDRRTPDKLSNGDHATADAVEGEIREFVRRDVSFLRRQRSEVDVTNDPAAEGLNALIGRVAGDSMEEIDRVIRELESVRDMMHNEGERVSRELAGYASMSHAATTAMKVIAASIKQWKDTQDKSGPRSAS
jgi:translation elongation factor EF-1beta